MLDWVKPLPKEGDVESRQAHGRQRETICLVAFKATFPEDRDRQTSGVQGANDLDFHMGGDAGGPGPAIVDVNGEIVVADAARSQPKNHVHAARVGRHRGTQAFMSSLDAGLLGERTAAQAGGRYPLEAAGSEFTLSAECYPVSSSSGYA